MNNSDYYMNYRTGTVDTLENWMAEDAGPESLGVAWIRVKLADGSEVPEDFIPCQSDRYRWVEADED